MANNNEPNILLAKALEERNLNAESYKLTENGNLTVFEKALQSHSCFEFVAECTKDKKDLQNYFQKNPKLPEYIASLEDPIVDIDSAIPGHGEVQKIPNIPLDGNDSEVAEKLKILSELGKTKQENIFIDSLTEFEKYLCDISAPRSAYPKICEDLFIIALQNGLYNALKGILKFKYITHEDYTKAVIISCNMGNYEAVHILLEVPDFLLQSHWFYLSEMFSNWKQINENSNYKRCLSVLLKSNKFAANEKKNILIWAIFAENEEAILMILEKGVYIDGPAMELLHPTLLEKHFDNCIIGDKCGNDDFNIHMNYMNLITKNVNQIGIEVSAIEKLLNSNSKKHLLCHPLIASFLFLQWHAFSMIFYLTVILRLIFWILVVLYIIFKFNNALNVVEGLILLLFIGLWYGYIIFENIITIKCKKINFVKLIKRALTIIPIITCFIQNYSNEPGRTFAVLTVLLVCVEIYMLLGSLPVLSLYTHMLILNSVCVSFVKSLFQYFMFFITFGLCFHIVFSKTKSSMAKSESTENNKYFDSALGSMFRSIVMITGEFDFANINFYSNTSYAIFLLFVVFMSILILNLLTGLAVSDTQIVRGNAQLEEYICCIHHLKKLEKFITVFKNYRGFNFIFKKLIISDLNCMHEAGSIYFFAKNRNNIYAYNNRKCHLMEWKTHELRYLVPIISHLSRLILNQNFPAMDAKIAEAAADVLDKKIKIRKEKSEQLEMQLRNIEGRVNEIESQLQKIERNGEEILLLLRKPS